VTNLHFQVARNTFTIPLLIRVGTTILVNGMWQRLTRLLSQKVKQIVQPGKNHALAGARALEGCSPNRLSAFTIHSPETQQV
jgi:hypothetical protein